MRLRDNIILVVCLLLAAILFFSSGMCLDYINSQRQQMKLVSNEPLQNAPPSLAFATVAMGAFRGLVVDILWMRADRLKQEGQFFDAKQLADWITTLQPRFATVWEFQAWNMAYNISVAIPASQPQERWRWVKNGYELLRDQGIPLNPKSILLYRELARIFQHKLGAVSDDAHKYYKIQLASAMEPLLGPANNEYFESLAKTPADWQQILKDPNIAQLIGALKSADKVFATEADFVSNYLALRQTPNKFDPNAFKVIDYYRNTQALKDFDIFAKAYQLRNVWKLDPVLMLELNKLYGPTDLSDPDKHIPLDWRHPDCHAIYWAIKGLRTAGKIGAQKGVRKEYSADEVNTDRIVAHSLQNLFINGKIFIYRSPVTKEASLQGMPRQEDDIFLRPDFRMYVAYDTAIRAIIEKYTDPNDKQMNSHQIGHMNMLRDSVLMFYQAGHLRQAEKLYNELRTLYPKDDFKVPLVVFARKKMKEELSAMVINDTKQMIGMLLSESYFRYSLRDDDEAFNREKWVLEIYKQYNEANPAENRIDLPDIKIMKYLALIDFLADEEYPMVLRQSLIGRIKIERPDLFKQLEQQEEMLRKQAEQAQNPK